MGLPRSGRSACAGGGLAWQITVIPANAVYARSGPTVIPWIATGMLAVLGVLLTVQGLRGGWEHERPGSLNASGLGWLLSGLALNVTLIGVAGFIIASTLLFVCTARAFGSRRLLRDAAHRLRAGALPATSASTACSATRSARA